VRAGKLVDWNLHHTTQHERTHLYKALRRKVRCEHVELAALGAPSRGPGGRKNLGMGNCFYFRSVGMKRDGVTPHYVTFDSL
jgi:hypothetical protein